MHHGRDVVARDTASQRRGCSAAACYHMTHRFPDCVSCILDAWTATVCIAVPLPTTCCVVISISNIGDIAIATRYADFELLAVTSNNDW